jgi:hypothetical protein
MRYGRAPLLAEITVTGGGDASTPTRHLHVLLLKQVGRAEHLKLLHAQRADALEVVGDVLHLLEGHRRGVVDLVHAARLEPVDEPARDAVARM